MENKAIQHVVKHKVLYSIGIGLLGLAGIFTMDFSPSSDQALTGNLENVLPVSSLTRTPPPEGVVNSEELALDLKVAEQSPTSPLEGQEVLPPLEQKEEEETLPPLEVREEEKEILTMETKNEEEDLPSLPVREEEEVSSYLDVKENNFVQTPERGKDPFAGVPGAQLIED